MSLELIDVSHRFGRQIALENVSLTVHTGDCYGFLGHNGAGKTTAMRILLGLHRPRRGSASVSGFDVMRSPHEARARVGGLIESPGFHGSWSGRANLLALARLQGLDRRSAVRAVDEGLESVGLAAAASRAVRGYSQGMRQRLGIAQALLGRPSHVVLDEPTNGLDPEGIQEIRELLRRWNRDEGVTLLISSHQLHEIHGLCNRIGLLRQGRLLVEGETHELLAGGRDRYRLAVDRPDLAARVLEDLTLEPKDDGEGGWEIDLKGHEPGSISRRLVEAGVGITAFAPRPMTLEEIYLSPPTVSESTTAAPSPASVSTERRAPRGPIRRTLRYEATRYRVRLPLIALLTVPAACGLLRLSSRASAAARDVGDVASGELISATQVTAFEGLGLSLQVGLPIAAVLLAAIASQSVSAELARGTLRNLLLRPLRRWELSLGKAGALLVLTTLSYGALLAGSWAAAELFFDFSDLVEILPNGEVFPFLSAAEMEAELARVLWTPLLPLAVYAGWGLCVGTLISAPAAALGVTLGGVVAFDLGRAVARSFELEQWLPASYLPSPLSDRSMIHYYVEFAGGVSNAQRYHEDTMVWVPLLWIVITVVASMWALSRRQVP